jgi:hypothetical protein
VSSEVEELPVLSIPINNCFHIWKGPEKEEGENKGRARTMTATTVLNQIPANNNNKGKKIGALHLQLKTSEVKKNIPGLSFTGSPGPPPGPGAPGNLSRKEKKRLKKLEASGTPEQHVTAAATVVETTASLGVKQSQQQQQQQHLNISAIAGFTRPVPVTPVGASVQVKLDSLAAPAADESSASAKKKKMKKKKKAKKQKESSSVETEPRSEISASISGDLIELARSYADYAACQQAEVRCYSCVSHVPGKSSARSRIKKKKKKKKSVELGPSSET